MIATIKIPLIATLALCCSVNANAGHGKNSNKHTDYARVIDATPVYRNVSHSVPQQECHIETVSYQEPNPHYRERRDYQSSTPMLLGSLIGGAIGHKAGHHKKAKNAGAVIGAVIGGSLGRDFYSNSRQNDYHSARNSTVTRYRDEEVCHTRQQTRYKEVLDGYDVSYKYKGRTYYTHMKNDPGRRIRVAVNVRPID